MTVRADPLAARRYLDSRRCRDGGYCFYRNGYLEESNLADTWHALCGYARLGAPVPDSARMSQLLKGYNTSGLGSDALYYRAFAQRLLAPDWQPEPVVKNQIAALRIHAPAREADFEGWLAGSVHKARLLAAFAELRPEPDSVAALRAHHRGGYGAIPNLIETARALELQTLFVQPDAELATAGFVDTLQDPQWGFRDTPDSSLSGLAVLFAGVDCCARLGLPVRYPDTILATLREAQYADGAFADVPGALPNLEATHQALALLDALASARNGPTRSGSDPSHRPTIMLTACSRKEPP